MRRIRAAREGAVQCPEAWALDPTRDGGDIQRLQVHCSAGSTPAPLIDGSSTAQAMGDQSRLTRGAVKAGRLLSNPGSHPGPSPSGWVKSGCRKRMPCHMVQKGIGADVASRTATSVQRRARTQQTSGINTAVEVRAGDVTSTPLGRSGRRIPIPPPLPTSALPKAGGSPP